LVLESGFFVHEPGLLVLIIFSKLTIAGIKQERSGIGWQLDERLRVLMVEVVCESACIVFSKGGRAAKRLPARFF
jgi:hypothetical protein